MAEQTRAIRTRQTILTAAAKIFEENGYQAATISQILTAAGVTKGALYFHFSSKEDLAQGVLTEQEPRIPVPERTSKVQEIVDTTMLHAHRLQTDPMVRAGVRLTMDQQANGLDRSRPFLNWAEHGTALFQQAQTQGELLPHVNPTETAHLIVASFAGIQSMSQAVSNYQDLTIRTSALMRHILPSVVIPSILTTLDLTPHRGATVHAETQQQQPTI